MTYLFTSESVSEGHPDKVADQISDALIDHFMAFDPTSKVACETLVTTGQVVLAGEVNTTTYLDVQAITREVIRKIGYTKSEYMFEANSASYENKVYILPKHLDEKVAFLHLAHIGAKLEKLEKEQAEYIGVPQAGPYKPEHYRY